MWRSECSSLALTAAYPSLLLLQTVSERVNRGKAIAIRLEWRLQVCINKMRFSFLGRLQKIHSLGIQDSDLTATDFNKTG